MKLYTTCKYVSQILKKNITKYIFADRSETTVDDFIFICVYADFQLVYIYTFKNEIIDIMEILTLRFAFHFHQQRCHALDCLVCFSKSLLAIVATTILPNPYN